MAISKILYIGDCGSGYAGKHLKQALDYISEEHKTGSGQWVASLNCQKENAYEQMRETKEQFGKTDKRQGYHLIISFAEGEIDDRTAFEVIGRFAKEYLGKDYEAVYSVHDNTDHIHGHILFNSVSFRTGKKYRYEKGDWAKHIQPITNRLCEEYGLSTIEISEERIRPSENYKEWNDFRDGKFVWADMVKRDIDACVLQAATYESFLSLLSGMGYEVKNAYREEGKYLAVKPMGLTRFRRCKSLGENYSEERIRERILTENLSTYRREPVKKPPRIVRCRFQRYRRARMSKMQKRYFARMYRLKCLKKRPYSQAWRYRDDIRKMQKLQEEYLFLVRHDIHTMAELAVVAEHVTDKKKESSKEKSRIFKEREKMKSLFDKAAEIESLREMENCYQKGEKLFRDEHEKFLQLEENLKKEGYSLEQLAEFKLHYRNEIARVREQEKAILKEERIAKRIMEEIRKADTGKEIQMEKQKEEEKSKELEKRSQPIL